MEIDIFNFPFVYQLVSNHFLKSAFINESLLYLLNLSLDAISYKNYYFCMIQYSWLFAHFITATAVFSRALKMF
jgi:hypothetical protein